MNRPDNEAPLPVATSEGVESSAETKSTVQYALVANLAVALVKGIAGVLTGSAALLAETAHSLADTGNQVLLRISLSRAEKPPDEDHPFGYGRERFFWALLVAVLVFFTGALFSVAEGIYAFFVRGGHDRFALAYAVLAFSFVAESLSLAAVLRKTRRGARRAGWSVGGYLRASTDPTVKTVIFEDAAAVAGVVIAAAGIGAHQLTGNRAWEGLASISIGCGLGFVAIKLGRASKDLIIGEPARPAERAAIHEAVLAHPEVDAVVDLRTVHLGPHQLFVAIRLDFRDGITSEAIEDVSTVIEEELRYVVPDVSDVFLDATNARRLKPVAGFESPEKVS